MKNSKRFNHPMTRYFILLLWAMLLGLAWPCNAQSDVARFRLQGTVLDARTGKAVKHAPITVMPFKRKVSADKQGRFLFNMPEGRYTLLIDEFPFNPEKLEIVLTCDTAVTIRLQSPEHSHYIDEVEVIAAKPVTESPASVTRLGQQALLGVPAVGGERDILKAVSLTAGVTPGNEGSAEMQVRGGDHGQNLFLLDGIPLYSTRHAYGLVSAFNPSIVQSATLYKSDFPASYGGKVSSVLDVTTRPADPEKPSGEAEIGILSTKGLVNVPIVKNRLALSVAGRISNFSLLNLFSPLLDDTQLGLHFADINANLNWKLSERDRLALSFFHNSDGTSVAQKDFHYRSQVWNKTGQQNVNLMWEHTFSPGAGNRLSCYADRYAFDFGMKNQSLAGDEHETYTVESHIASIALEDRAHWTLSTHWQLHAGATVKANRFAPFTNRLYATGDSHTYTGKQGEAGWQYEAAAFAQAGFTPTARQDLHAGLRLSASGNAVKSYVFAEPRIGYHGLFGPDIAVSASVSRMSQPVHRVANPGLGLPVELFVPSSVTLRPETSWNYSAGIAKDFRMARYAIGVKADLWYKQLDHIVDYREGYNAMNLLLFQDNLNGEVESMMTQGTGKAYGVDLSANYVASDFSLTADYTLMEARNRFDELNGGREFAAPTDIRHSLTLAAEVKLPRNWKFSATWQLRSGMPITLPTHIYMYPELDFYGGSVHFTSPGDYTEYQIIETERNNYRTRPFHKLDIAFSRQFKTIRKRDAFLSIGIYNVYNRANPYMYYIQTEGRGEAARPVLKSVSIFPIMPNISYMIRF